MRESTAARIRSARCWRSAAPSASATACGRSRTRRSSKSCATGGIPLEVCPTSNVCLGVFPDLASHSFDRLYRSGVPVSVNSDDGPLFSTDLTREYLALHRTFGYGPEELAGLAMAGLRQSFLPDEEKAGLEKLFRT